MTTSDKVAFFLRLAAKSKTNYGVAGLVALPVLCAWLPPVFDGRLLLNFPSPDATVNTPGLLFNIHFETATVIAYLAPFLGLLTSWFRAIAKGPLWPVVQPAVSALVSAVEKAQTQQMQPDVSPANQGGPRA